MKNITSTTQEKIYKAFEQVLSVKNYNDIRIQDILDVSTVARSTFYAHYKTKEDLLHSICEIIFDHVFSHSLDEEHSHDFSKTSIFEYRHFFTHILYHLHDEKNLIKAIYSSESKDAFINYIRTALEPFALECVKNNFVHSKCVPEEIMVSTLVENFIIIISYWIKNDFKELPETLTNYYFELIS